MRTIDSIDIEISLTVLRVLAALLTGAALLCFARVGPRPLAASLSTVLALLVVGINTSWMGHVDTAVEMWIRPHRSPGALAGWSEIWTYMGDPIYFAAVVLTFGAWFSWRARSAMPVAVMVAAVGVGSLLEQSLKIAVGRAPATVAPLQADTLPPNLFLFLHSFPSGHVTVVGVLLGTAGICLCAGRRLATKVQVAVAAAAGVAAVGLLAVYLRAHTFTDVIGGTVLSAAIIAMASPTLTAAMSRGRRVPTRAVAPTRPAAALVRRDRVQVG